MLGWAPLELFEKKIKSKLKINFQFFNKQKTSIVSHATILTENAGVRFSHSLPIFIQFLYNLMKILLKMHFLSRSGHLQHLTTMSERI